MRKASAAPVAKGAAETGRKADIECQVVVLGSGPGGYTAAFRAADLGQNTVLIERYSALGGVCLNVGCIPSKALLHAARVIDEAAHAKDFGVEYGEPKIDLAKLRAYKDKVVAQMNGGLAGMSKQRKVAVGAFLWGFIMWIALIFIGTFIRGPGWVWFWPGQTWDHNVQLYEINRDLPDLVGITGQPWKGIFGLLVVAAFYLIAGLVIHILISWSKFEKKIFERTTLLQYSVFQFFAITVLVSMPVKLLIRQVFRIKYVMVTPWFNI